MLLAVRRPARRDAAGARAQRRRAGSASACWRWWPSRSTSPGSVESWTVAGAFGQRRFVALTVAAGHRPGGRARRARRPASRARSPRRAGRGASCVWWNLGLMVQFGAGLMDRQRLEPGAQRLQYLRRRSRGACRASRIATCSSAAASTEPPRRRAALTNPAGSPACASATSPTSGSRSSAPTACRRWRRATRSRARGHEVRLVVRPDSATPARDPFAFYGLPPDRRRSPSSTCAAPAAPLAARRAGVRRAQALGGARPRARRTSCSRATCAGRAAAPAAPPPRAAGRVRVARVRAGGRAEDLPEHALERAPRRRRPRSAARLEARERRVWRRGRRRTSPSPPRSPANSRRASGRGPGWRWSPTARACPTADARRDCGTRRAGGRRRGLRGHLYPWKGLDVLIGGARAAARRPRAHRRRPRGRTRPRARAGAGRPRRRQAASTFAGHGGPAAGGAAAAAGRRAGAAEHAGPRSRRPSRRR